MNTRKETTIILGSYTLDTPMGSMVAVGDDDALYALDFAHTQNAQKKLKQLQSMLQTNITCEKTASISSIESELASYFAGTLQQFKTPLGMVGTPFAQAVLQQLMNVPYGQTRSYTQLATMIGNQKACRAVARANAANCLAIVIPCHRIINSNGALGGYAGGIAHKKWLLQHESKFI
jgi:O-6-methylguanine DNA methyltransferase